MTRFKVSISVAVCLILCAGFTINAQVTTATIYGSVLDPSGAAVPRATITATHEQTSLVKTATTNVRGEFTLAFLPVGTYTVTIVAPGFKTYTETALALSAGQKADLIYQLELGTATETVTVTTEAPLMNTVNAQQDIRLDNRQVTSLPVQQRDITHIIDLGTGASSAGDTITLNGLAPRGFTFTVDGVDASPDPEFASLSLYQNFNMIKGVSLEAVKEVQVTKNIFSAEIGNTISGNVNIISKAGTNEFHGSAFETYNSGGLNAVNNFVARKAPLVFHQFGGSLGGPLVPDKLFFFAVYEGYRLQANEPLTGQVPSKWARGEITTALPDSKPYFDLWPLPTGGEQPGDVAADFNGVGNASQFDDHGVLRLDYRINDNNMVTGRLVRGHPNRVSPRLILGNPRDRIGLNGNVASTWVRVWSPNLTSETRFSYNRSDLDRLDRILTLNLPAVLGAGLPNFGQGRLFSKKGSTTTIEDNFALTKGRHSLKFGGMYRIQFDRRIIEDVPRYNYATFDDIRANNASSAFFNFGLDQFELKQWGAGLFLQDDIRASSKLTLNVGFRWDYSSVPRERDGRIFNRNGPFGDLLPPSRAFHARYEMYSPRIGFAYNLNDKTVIRAGFGVFFIPFNFFAGPVEVVKNDAITATQASLSTAQLQSLGIQFPDSREKVKPLVTASGIISGSSIDPNIEHAYSMQYTFGIERQITPDMVWSVSYVGNGARKLIYSPDWNLVDRVTGIRPREDFTRFRYYQSADNSTYNSLQTSFKKRFSHNLQFNTAYTYASNLSYFRGDLTCCGASEQPQDTTNMKLNRAPTSFMVRHRLTTDFVYDVPVPAGWNSTLEKIFGGYEVSGVFIATSGGSLRISQGSSGSGARPDIAPGFTYDTAVRSDFDQRLPNGTFQYLDKAAFLQVPINPVSGRAIRPGTLGRRAIFGPGQWNIDFSVAKNLTLRERFRLQFRVDLFNALNHVNLRGVQTNIRSSKFGQVTSVGNGREVRLNVRFDF